MNSSSFLPQTVLRQPQDVSCGVPPEVRSTTRCSEIAHNRLVAAQAAEVCFPFVSDNSPLAEVVQLAVPANFN
jgi:hypothetical protein